MMRSRFQDNIGKLVKRRVASRSDYDALLSNLVGLLEHARRSASRAVNAVLTMTYWEIGRSIFEHQQEGQARAGYGEELLGLLARDLSARFGRGFSRANVSQMRQFYLAYRETIETVSGQSGAKQIVQTPSGQLKAWPFPLSWSHYVRLLSVQDTVARQFYEQESVRGGWSVRQLDR